MSGRRYLGDWVGMAVTTEEATYKYPTPTSSQQANEWSKKREGVIMVTFFTSYGKAYFHENGEEDISKWLKTRPQYLALLRKYAKAFLEK